MGRSLTLDGVMQVKGSSRARDIPPVRQLARILG